MRSLAILGGLVALAGVAGGVADGARVVERSRPVPVALDVVRERPSATLQAALRANVVSVYPVGAALAPRSTLLIIGRGTFRIAGFPYQLLAVRFQGKDGSRCWGVTVLMSRDSPGPFDCDTGGYGGQGIGSDIVLTTAVTANEVRSIDLGLSQPDTVDADRYSIPADDHQRLWIIPLHGRALVLDTVFRDAAGRAIGGTGMFCLKRPGLCPKTPAPSPPKLLTLITRSGKQAEVGVTEFLCGRNQGCASGVVYAPGLPPKRFTVVRPGERVRITGMQNDKDATLIVWRIPPTCSTPFDMDIVAHVARTKFLREGKFLPLSPTGEWNAKLIPGYYALSAELTIHQRDGSSIIHSGLFGIHVSRARPLGTTPAPC